jgi:hypothetical protein
MSVLNDPRVQTVRTEKEARSHGFHPLTHAYSILETWMLERAASTLLRGGITCCIVQMPHGKELWRR